LFKLYFVSFVQFSCVCLDINFFLKQAGYYAEAFFLSPPCPTHVNMPLHPICGQRVYFEELTGHESVEDAQ